MTQSAGIQLQVGLDLAFFRQQLTTLGTTAAGHKLPINVKFDRLSVQNELNALDANIKKRNYFLEVKTNLAAEIKNAKDLATALNDLAVAQKAAKSGMVQRLGVGALGRAPSQGGLGSKDVEKLYRASARAGLFAFDREIVRSKASMVAAMEAVGIDSIAGLLNGLNSQNAQLKEAAQSLGKDLLASVKNVLGIASPSKKFEEIGKNVGEGFEKGVLSSMDNAFDALENKMRQRGKILDTVARGIFRMLGMDPAAMLQQARALPPLNFGATVPRAPVGIGSSSRGRLLPAAPSRTAIAGTPAPAGLLPSLSSVGRSKAIIEALIASTGPRLLPSGGGDDSLGKLAAPRQTKDAVDAILRNYFKVVEAQVREVFSGPPIKKESLNIFDHLDTEQYFNYLAQARVNAENAIKQSIEEAKQVAKQNQVKDAAQSFLRALEETVRNAERSVFLQSRIAANQSYVQKANIREIGQPLLGGRKVAAPKMLSAATGFYRGASAPPPLPETQAQLFARREREARMRSALRGVDVMGETPTRAPARYSYANRPAMPRRPTSAIVPYAAGGALVPAGGGSGGAIPPRPTSGGGGMGGMANFGKALGGINLPGAGVVREIGSEFAMAAKQVLLFGTAYKALAFLTSFPSQVGEAIGALQSFNNTLKAISPSAEEAKASNQFILDIVDRYNVPLQSARDGFTKLYASMAPAGFKGDEIRALFTGVSQAAATFGMSADKVDRVNYAFAQMASKGQVMSEELKGQLGDVLPGAMGIFAKAAGFEGADAIQKFGKALEDGAYKGKPMRDLLKNVTIELKKEFGPGAEGAARTYQGVMTRMANSTKLLYESFEPVAINFLNSIVVPITGGLKTVTDGFKAFFTGQAAQTTGGGAFAKQLEALRPAFEGIRSNITSLVPIFQSFGKILLATSQVFLQIAGNPFVGYLARVYLNVVALTTVFNILNLRALIPFVANLARSIYSVVAFGVQCTLAGQKAVFFDLMVRTLGTTLRTFFAATAVGIILVGIGLIAEAFVTAGARADAARQKMSQFADSVKQLGAAGDVAGATAEKVGQQSLAARLQSAKTLLQQVKSEGRKLTKDQVQELKNLQLTNNLDFVEVGRGPEKGLLVAQGKITNLLGTQSALQAEIESAGRGYLETQTKIVQATKAVTVAQGVQKKQEKESKTAESTAIDLTGGKDAKIKSLESYHSLQEQLAKAQTQSDIDRIEAAFEHRKQLINNVYDLEETRANSIQKEAIAHQRAISDIFLDLQKKQIDARLSMMKAEGSVAGGAAPMGATTSGKTGLLQGSTGISSGPHFDVRRQDGAYISPDQARALFDPSVRGQLAMTSAYGPRKAPVPGASTFHKGVDLAGPVNTPLNLAAGYAMTGAGEKGGLGYAASVRGPQGEMYDVGHLQRPAPGAGAPRKVPGSEKRDVVAEQAKVLAGKQAVLLLTHAEIEAQQALVIETEKYLAQIFGIAEKELQTSMLQKKTAMLRAGATDQEIEDAMSLEEINLKYTAGVDAANKQIAANNKLIAEGSGDKNILNKNTAAQLRLIARLNEELPKATKAQTDLNEAQKDAPFLQRIRDLKEEIKLLLIVNDAERRLAELRNDYGGDAAKAQQVFNLEEVKKNIEATRALIGDFVSSTSSDYKGFLKAVISGEDAADALKQFQEGLKDRVLTIFLDFAMAPVEKFFKEGLEGLFLPKAGSIPGLDAAKEATKDPVEATNSNTNATVENTQAIKDFTASMSGGGTGGSNQAAGFSAGMQDLGGVAFDGGNSSAIDTSLEGWSTALNTSISDSIKESTGKVKVEGATFKESLSKAVGAVGMAAGAIMGIAAGVSQVKQGGTSNVLGGIGSIMTSIGGVLGGFGGLFGGGGGGGGLGSGFNAGTSSAVGTGSAGWASSFATPLKFANGGMVTGPTLGLIGEGKYNEAIVPLPDGRSIPVQFNQQSSLREAMAGGSNNASAPSVLSMTFESTNINGVEYVSRDQLEQAMAQTRRQASRDGAQRGMTMTLDKLQQSPSTRSRLGMR